MEENLLYFNGLNVLDKNNYSYCVDMLRLRCSVTVDIFERCVVSKLFIYKDKIETWDSTRICDFYHNYNYSDEDCSFWFGFISNKEKSMSSGSSLQNENKQFNLTVEFNPNKVKDNKLLLHILKCSTNWYIKSVDFAVDINTNILNVVGFDKSQKNCLMTYDCGGDDKTFYIGKGNNRVKVYNKTNESNLLYDLTRIEITRYFGDSDNLKIIKSWKYYGYFPELFLKDYQITIDDLQGDRTLMALVYAVNSGLPLHDLSRKYKIKVKEFLQKKKPIEIDFNCFGITLVKYLVYYFPFINDF